MANPYIELYKKKQKEDQGSQQTTQQTTQTQKQTQATTGNPYIDLYNQRQQQSQPSQQQPTAYEQRKARQEKASEAAKKAWWEVLGLAAQDATAAAQGQQRTLTAEEGRQRATAGANLAAATKENREANKVNEWDGRKELLKEYRRLDEIDNPKARHEAAAIREQLRQGDIKAGNLDTDGDMAYNVGDWSSNVVPGAAKDVGSAIYKTALTIGDLYAKGQAAQGPTEQEIITEYLTGQEIGSTAKMRQQAYNSESYRGFMNERYAEAARLAASAKRNLQIAKENQAPVVKAGTDVAVNMLEMGFDGGVAMLTGGSALVPMAARVFGSAALEAQEAGASLEQQALYGLSSAALEVATEKLGDGLGGLYGRGFTQNATEHMIQRLASTDPGRTFLRFISGLNSEGMEEVISGVFEPALKSIYNGKTPWQNYSEFEWGDLLYNYALGAAAAIFGGASSIVNGGNAYANAQLRAADAAQAQTDSNFGWMLPVSVKEQAQGEQFDRMFIGGTPNAPTRSESPAQKPEMKEAKTPAQRRVEAIINAAATQDQLVQSLQFFQSKPELDAAFEELTGSDIDAYLAEATQEAAGGVVPQEGNPAPATPENAQQQAPGEFNSVNEADESGERGNAEKVWPNMNYDRIAEWQNRNMRDASGTAVDFITGDLYNHNNRPYRQFEGELHPKQLEWSADATQQQYGYAEPKNSDNGRRQTDQYNSTIQTAIEQVREDGTNANRIMEGVGEWRDVDPQVRADIMNHIDPRGDYYVSEDKASGGKVVAKAASRLESETNERSDNFYGQEMRDAGVKDVSPQEIRNGALANSGARLETRYDYGYIPSERRSAAASSVYTSEELAAIDKYNRRRDAQKHRENFENWLTEHNIDPGKEPVRNPRLGEPRIELRSAWMQRTMRDKALLGDLVNGTGSFKQFSAANRLDALRTMYPDANWQFDASTNTITLPGDPALGKSRPSFDWKKDNTPVKKTVAGKAAQNGGISVENLGKKVEEDSRRRSDGTGRRVSNEQFLGRVARGLVRDGTGVSRSVRDAGAEGSGPEANQRGNEERDLSAAPVLRSQEEYDELKRDLDTIKKRGWHPIGRLTQSMADTNKLANILGVPLVHADGSESSSKSGGFSSGLIAVLRWGKGPLNKAPTAVHEMLHVKTTQKFGSHAEGGRLLNAAIKDSAIASKMKAVGKVYRNIYEATYSQREFGKKYSDLDEEQKARVSNLIGAEILNDVLSNDPSNFKDSGAFDEATFAKEFGAFRKACVKAALEGQLLTREEMNAINDYLKKKCEDDYRLELTKENLEREEKRDAYEAQNGKPKDSLGTMSHAEFERRLKAGEFNFAETLRKAAEESKGVSEKIDKEEAQQRGDYRLGPKAAAKLDAEAHANTTTVDPYDDGGIDVDADDFEQPYRADNKEMQRREDLNRRSEVEQRQQPKTKGETPESSKQYLQQNRLRKSDFENRETERGGTEAQYKAEQAEIREEIEHDEAYDRAQEEGKQLAEMKKAYGEKTQKSLADLAKKARGLVGSSRLNTSGQRGYINKDGELVGHVKGDVTESFSYNKGGRDIESFAYVLGEFAAGRQTFTQLAEAYDKLGSYSEKKKGSYFYDKVFAEQFERLRDALDNGDVRTKDGALDPKFVRSVEDLTKRVVHRFEYMQKMLKFRSHLAEVYGEGKPFRTKAGAFAKALEAAHRFQLRPSTAFKMLSGYDKAKGSAWYELADMARDATKNYINTFQNAQDYLRELTERKDWEDFSTGKTTVKNVIPGLKYDGGRLSANAAVSFLKMLETDGAYDHIIRNGVVEMARTEKELYGGQNNNGFGDVTGYSQTFDPISKETRAMLDKAKTREEREAARAKATAELNAIKAALHAEVEACPAAKAFYDASFAPLNFLKKALNKTSRKVWGTDAAVQDKFYWPLEAGGNRQGNELLNDHSFGLDQYRNVQARTGDRGGLKVRPATDVMQGYIRSASHWAAYQELSDMLEILSKDFRDTSSITQLLNDNAGKAWSKWLENYEADLNENRGKDKGYAGKIIGSLRSNLAQSSLLLNAGVALKQAPSGLDFMTVLDADIVAKRFATGFFRSARSHRNNPLIQTMEAYTKMLKNRQAGYNTVETGEATETGRKGFVNKLVDKLPNWMTNWITKTDFRTVANGLLACEDQVKQNIKDGLKGYADLQVGTDAYYQKIADLFENAVMDTQPIYNKEYRADALRTDNEVLRILNMFRTQQTQNYNNLVETIGEYNAAKQSGDEAATKAARNRMGRTIAGQVSSAFVFAMLDAAAKMLMHKKKQYEDEDGNLSASIISQKVGWNFANSLASTSWLASKISPFVINQVTKLANKATDGKVAKSDFYSGSLDGTLALVDDFASALDSFTTKPSLKTGKALVLNLASMTGMPLKNGYNIVNAAIMHFYLDPSGKNVNNEDDIISYLDNYYKLSDESKAKQSVLRAISVNSKGNSEGADTIMATLNLDDEDITKAAKQQLKDSFIAGEIDGATYRDMLRKYFGASSQEVLKFLHSAEDAKLFNGVENNVKANVGEKAYEQFTKSMSKLNGTTDPTGKERLDLISGLGLTEKETDIYIQKFMPTEYYGNYEALRSIGFKPNRAHAVLANIDADSGGTITQEEVYSWLLDNSQDKRVANALWEARGWSTSLDKYAESYAKNPVNILVSFGMDKKQATRVSKQLNYDGKNGVTQEDFFNYLKKHPDQEEALKAVFSVKWPKSDYESKKRKYS
jgi:hypothetical protein